MPVFFSLKNVYQEQMYQAGADKKYQRTANDQPVGLFDIFRTYPPHAFSDKRFRGLFTEIDRRAAQFYAKCSGCGGLTMTTIGTAAFESVVFIYSGCTPPVKTQ